MYFTKIPPFIQGMFKNYLWHGDRSKKEVFLTFDDGPHPESTPFILDILSTYKVQATFFCLGENIEKHPQLFQRIKEEGHQVGNHSYSHLSGWSTSTKKYVDDVNHANKLINSKLFRPPYGRITPQQAKVLSKNYKIVMWDVMPGDFDERRTEKEVVNNVIRHMDCGSVIVLHDFLFEHAKNEIFFPQLLDKISEADYTFSLIKSLCDCQP